MSSTAPAGAPRVSPKERLGMLFEEFAELSGQRNAIDGRIVDVVAEIDHDGLCGMTGARSVAALVAWKLGMSSTTANTIATVAHRLDEFPRCAQGLREGRFSLDQVGAIAGKAASGSDSNPTTTHRQLNPSVTAADLRSNRQGHNPTCSHRMAVDAISPMPPSRLGLTRHTNPSRIGSWDRGVNPPRIIPVSSVEASVW